MIARYSREEMSRIWNDDERIRRWLKVELAVADVQAKIGMIPAKEGKVMVERGRRLLAAKVPMRQILEREAITRHDVIAFADVYAQRLGAVGRFLHFGLTSTDVVDTALAMAVQDAGVILLREAARLRKSLLRQAEKYRDLACVGRTHGMHAEPTSFGLKFLGWYCEVSRATTRLERALAELRYGKLSGAVGANAHYRPDTERKILKGLGLEREPVSTQVLPRDRLGELFSAFALMGAAIERFCTEIRHLQRSEVAELREGFAKKQKGSSAMPHKRNPISAENLCGIARLLRSYTIPALENIALWHERDISHSSVERVILPDACIVLDYALDRAVRLVDGLEVDAKRVRANLDAAGPTLYSGHVLLELVQRGIERDQAYRWIQEVSHAVLDGRGEKRKDWMATALQHRKLSKSLGEKDLRALVSPERSLRHVGEIYQDAKKQYR